ncbi:MAG: coproporphyrinogen III oxidase, partial [Synechococcus sp.]
MVRSLIRRVLGRQDVGVSKAPLELPPSDSRERARAMVMGLQDEICAGLEALDGEGRFVEESWVRPEGGGGRSRVMREGRVFEQGGVNFSEVQGEELPPSILKQRPEAKGGSTGWFRPCDQHRALPCAYGRCCDVPQLPAHVETSLQ